MHSAEPVLTISCTVRYKNRTSKYLLLQATTSGEAGSEAHVPAGVGAGPVCGRPYGASIKVILNKANDD